MVSGRAKVSLAVQGGDDGGLVQIQLKGIVNCRKAAVKVSQGDILLRSQYGDHVCPILGRIDQGNGAGGVIESRDAHSGHDTHGVYHKRILGHDDVDLLAVHGNGDELAAAVIVVICDIGYDACNRNEIFVIHGKYPFLFIICRKGIKVILKKEKMG